MIRKWIPLDRLEIYDHMHVLQEDGSFIVDAEKDGHTTEEHRAGVDYVKSVIEKGAKTMPILAMEYDQGNWFKRLDGFKRALAYKELGHEYVEAFVCTEREYTDAVFVPYLGKEMRCFHGGQPHEDFSLFEGLESENSAYEDVHFLYKGKHVNIEVRENIHVHWGEMGKYRIEVGRRDFLALAEAISKVEI